MYYFCTAISNRNLQLFRSGLFGAASAVPNLFEQCRVATKSRKIWNKFCGNSSVGRARPCQGRGREFESRFPLTVLSNMNHPVPKRTFWSSESRSKTSFGFAESRQKAAKFGTNFAEIAQLVEHDLAKVGVASSSLVFRSDISA